MYRRIQRQNPHPDDKYLFEFDLDENGMPQFDTDGKSLKFTDRAKAAQAAKWTRLEKHFGPRKLIKKSMLVSSGGPEPYRLAYGWAFDGKLILDYAIHHNIEYDATESPWMMKEAGTPVIKYGELTEEQKNNKKLMNELEALATLLVQEDLCRRAGIELAWARPFSLVWTSMFVLYTNYNIEERLLEMEEVDIAHAIDLIEEALAFGDYKPELLWWYDWN
ncbi:hypothetical protein L227DRAFT_534906, partial [Lentinus tigrinus ALCF2SS1-6]